MSDSFIQFSGISENIYFFISSIYSVRKKFGESAILTPIVTIYIEAKTWSYTLDDFSFCQCSSCRGQLIYSCDFAEGRWSEKRLIRNKKFLNDNSFTII